MAERCAAPGLLPRAAWHCAQHGGLVGSVESRHPHCAHGPGQESSCVSEVTAVVSSTNPSGLPLWLPWHEAPAETQWGPWRGQASSLPSSPLPSWSGRGLRVDAGAEHGLVASASYEMAFWVCVYFVLVPSVSMRLGMGPACEQQGCRDPGRRPVWAVMLGSLQVIPPGGSQAPLLKAGGSGAAGGRLFWS